MMANAGYFSTAIEMLEVIDWIPDIIHCNDWHTAMVPIALSVDRYHWKVCVAAGLDHSNLRWGL